MFALCPTIKGLRAIDRISRLGSDKGAFVMLKKININYKIATILALFVLSAVVSVFGIWQEIISIRERHLEHAEINKIIFELNALKELKPSIISNENNQFKEKLESLEKLTTLHQDRLKNFDTDILLISNSIKEFERTANDRDTFITNINKLVNEEIQRIRSTKDQLNSQLTQHEALPDQTFLNEQFWLELSNLESKDYLTKIVEERKTEEISRWLIGLGTQNSPRLAELISRMDRETRDLSQLNNEREQYLAEIDSNEGFLNSLTMTLDQLESQLKSKLNLEYTRFLKDKIVDSNNIDNLLTLALQARRSEKEYFLSGSERHAEAFIKRIKAISTITETATNSDISKIADLTSNYLTNFDRWRKGILETSSAGVDQAGRQLIASIKKIKYLWQDNWTLKQLEFDQQEAEQRDLTDKHNLIKERLRVAEDALRAFVKAGTDDLLTELLSKLESLLSIPDISVENEIQDLTNSLHSYQALLQSITISDHTASGSIDQVINLVKQLKVEIKHQSAERQQAQNLSREKLFNDIYKTIEIMGQLKALALQLSQYDSLPIGIISQIIANSPLDLAQFTKLSNALKQTELHEEAITTLQIGIDDILQKLTTAALTAENDTAKELSSEQDIWGGYWFIVGVILLLLVTIFLVIPFMRNLTNRLNEATAYSKSLMRGEPSGTLDVVCKDELGELSLALMEVGNRLWPQLKGLKTSTETFVKDLNMNYRQLEQLVRQADQWRPELARASNQLTGVANIAHRLTDQSSTSRETANMANLAHDTGKGAMQRVEVGIELIGDRVDQLSEIAFKANVLALNSAVEAAKAGVGGKGFAVVASEMREFADNSRKLVRELHKAVEKGRYELEMAQEQMNATQERLHKGADHVQSFVDTAEKQVKGLSEVSIRLTQVDKGGNTHLHSLKMLVSNVSALTEQANNLKKSLSSFRSAGIIDEDDGLLNLENDDSNFSINHTLS